MTAEIIYLSEYRKPRRPEMWVAWVLWWPWYPVPTLVCVKI